MDWKEYVLLGVLLLLFVVMYLYYSKCKRKFGKVLLGALSGVAVLYPVQLVLAAMGFSVTMNLFTVSVAVILGIPGVVLLAVAACI